jgi:predicted acylesterase/phospholipase RssA
MECYPIKLLYNQPFDILCLSGGSDKGVIFIGMLHALSMKRGNVNPLQFNAYIGTSIGSIISFLLCIQYSPLEIYQLILRENISLINIIIYIKNNIPYANMTFEELYELYPYKLTMTTFNLSTKSLEYLNYETNPTLKIIEAIEMSSCVPIVCRPFEKNGHLYVDGALGDQFPLEYATKQYPHQSILALGVYLDDEPSSSSFGLLYNITVMINGILCFAMKRISKIRRNNVNFCMINVKCKKIVDMFDEGTAAMTEWIAPTGKFNPKVKKE